MEKIQTKTSSEFQAKSVTYKKSNGQSLMNNFHSIPDSKYNAAKAKFFIRRLREETGTAEQRLIVSLILQGFEVSREISSEVREQLRREWMLASDNGNGDNII